MRRVVAGMVDYAVIACWAMLVAAMMLSVPEALDWASELTRSGPWAGQLLGFLVLTLPAAGFLFAGEAGRRATLGKRLLGLTVIAGPGRRPQSRILIRTCVKLLPWEVAHGLVWHLRAMGWGAPPSTAATMLQVALVVDLVAALACVGVAALGRRPLHDLLAGTRVVNRRS